MITVQVISAPSHLLRLIDDRQSPLREDGLPPYTATCLLVPTEDDPHVAEVCGLVLAHDKAKFGWHVRTLRELLVVAKRCGYKQLIANTDGRVWPRWSPLENGWIGVDLTRTQDGD